MMASPDLRSILPASGSPTPRLLEYIAQNRGSTSSFKKASSLSPPHMPPMLCYVVLRKGGLGCNVYLVCRGM